MTSAPTVAFLLDTPNVWRGRALAGTPARVLGLAEHSRRAGVTSTVVLCDRGAEYGTARDWPCEVVLVHPADFYTPRRLARALESVSVDFLSICEAEALVAVGRELSVRLGARLIYDVHDDEAAIASTLGEPPETVRHYTAIQQAAFDATDYVIVSTRHEAALAQKAGIDPVRTVVVPNGVAVEERRCWGPAESATTLAFVGNLYYEPNARALEAIRRIIVPSLRTHGICARVRVIGRGPAALMAPDQGWEFTGRVDSIHDALRGVTVALAPLTAGSGSKLKVLDYLAAGLPVLGTSEAVTGLPPEHHGVLVENDLHAWSSILAALLGNPIALRELGTDGRLSVEQDLSWTRIGADLTRQIHTWLAAPAPTPHPGLTTGLLSTPRWRVEHTAHHALGNPTLTQPGQPHWLRRLAAPTHALTAGQKA